VHHGTIVRECREKKKKIELFFLPAYSPEKNPDEYLNCGRKRGLSDRPSPKDAKTLTGNVRDYMEMLRRESRRG